MYKIIPYGDSSLLINFKQVVSDVVNDKVVHLYHQLIEADILGVVSVIPSYCSITIRYKSPCVFKELSIEINKLTKVTQSFDLKNNNVKLMPVCYHESLALDKQAIEVYTKLSWDEIIKLHSENTYRVFMIGFTPGFPYLGGLHQSLTIPRLKTPRLQVPKGVVGLANNQTGIYPMASPGGWQIIGQTPISLFNPEKEFTLSIGDCVRFYEISLQEFNNWTHED